mgnify:CR=1 FL=1
MTDELEDGYLVSCNLLGGIADYEIVVLKWKKKRRGSVVKSSRLLKKVVVIALSSAMLVPASGLTVQASGFGNQNSYSIGNIFSGIADFFEDLFGLNGTKNLGTELSMVEDETTVSDATRLRASTYQTADSRAQDIKYFPVTLFNYDSTAINQEIMMEEAKDLLENGQSSTAYWKGLYFSDGDPTNDDGQDVALSIDVPTGEVHYEPREVFHNRNGNYDSYENGDYYLDEEGSKQVTRISCERYWSWGSYRYTWTIEYNGGEEELSGNPITLYQRTGSVQTVSANGIAGYNFWTGNTNAGSNPSTGVTSGDSTRGYIYSGLVNDRLVNNNISFNVPNGGIFDESDTTTKEVYTNVGMPFEFDPSTGNYTFDSDEMAAYYAGEPASSINLTYSDMPAAFNYDSDKYYTGFFPFNGLEYVETNATTSSSETTRAYRVTGNQSNGSAINGAGNSAADFWFGMTASISFTMNPDGTVQTEDGEVPAEFTFSGDDDVWVFVDDYLVLDLGGIHDSVSGSFNFQDNTIKMWATNTSNSSGDIANRYQTEGSDGLISQGYLFDTTEGISGRLHQDINTFCSRDEHTLKIYYLERGGGLSNNKIQFNLPQRDSLTVTKNVNTTDSSGVGLTEEQQNTVNHTDFGYTLFDDNEQPMAYQPYSLYSANGGFIENRQTDNSGHFSLHNGQTAKFYGLTFEGSETYYVVEDEMSGFVIPEWRVGVTGNSDPLIIKPEGYVSQKVTITGSEEATETIAYTCVNTVEHQDTTAITPQNDRIVIDYGLPVLIDVLSNDLVYNGTKELISVNITNGAEYGNARIKDGSIEYELTKPLSEIVTLEYTVKAKAPDTADDDKTATANVTIIPATTMYYEEDFSDLVKYSDAWTPTGNSGGTYQETGVVGDTTDSPYGSDQAYKDDRGDSNGTSKHVSTSSSSASFEYSFTGTGTSFFARTTNNSGYMRVVIKDEDGNLVHQSYRDTSYKTEDDELTMYNIPVFTYEAEQYGTYTVTVSIAKNVGAMKYGTDFWLDGIRVYNPIVEGSSDYIEAERAYSMDGEANNTIVTLRDKLIADSTYEDETGDIVWSEVDQENGNFVVFTDTNGEIISASEYISNGPKEELYLQARQRINFALSGWDSNIHKLYLGMKSPKGEEVTIQINNERFTISNTTDCYYDITNYVRTIEEKGNIEVEVVNGLASVTNIKTAGDAKLSIFDPTAE